MSSTTVADILTQTLSVISTTLGSTYHQVPFVYDVKKLNIRTAKLGYGARPLNSESAQGVNRAITNDHYWEILLTDTYANDASDSDRLTAITTMFGKADDIFKAMINTKLNLPLVVINVFDPQFQEPETHDAERLVALRMKYKVKWRTLLT